MKEVLLTVYVIVLSLMLISVPTQREVCGTIAKNNLTGSGYQSRRLCETSIEMMQNVKMCDFASNFGIDFNNCMDRRTQAMLHDWDSEEVRTFVEKLSNDAKKEHKS